MLLSIHHDTQYTFSEPVFLEPHAAQLRPREDAWQRVREWSLQIIPKPVGRGDGSGPGDAPQTLFWFEGLHSQLRLESRAVVETSLVNPFDFLIHPMSAQRLPMEYSPAIAAVLAPALSSGSPKNRFDPAGLALTPDNPISALSLELAREADGKTVDFLMMLTRRLHQMIERVRRLEGPPNPPAETLVQKRGSCRDTTLLFMHVARAQGMAARFVSGYFFPAGDDSPDTHELHAWAEVFLPGAGWHGFDPSVGLACADRHAALAASPDPALTIPLVGTYRGKAMAKLTATVKIEPAAKSQP